MKNIEYQERICDCCGSNDYQSVWEYKQSCPTHNDEYNWNVRNVICKECGFAFVSPAPTADSLAAYYGDSYSAFAGQEADYSIENRLRVIRQCVERVGATSFLEVGSNDCPEFIAEVRKLFSCVDTVELNQSCESSHRSMVDVASESMDLVASYFVLEHVPNPKGFLSECSRVL